MTRDSLARMDVDTRWAYHRKVRKLQRLYPDHWPIYWAAYMAHLGEAWSTGRRNLTLEQAWCPAIPCEPADALAALIAAEIVDEDGRIPAASWREWYGPVASRLKTRSDAGKAGALARWGKRGDEPEAPGGAGKRSPKAMRPHKQPDAPHQPDPPSKPSAARGKSPTSIKEALLENGVLPELVRGPAA